MAQSIDPTTLRIDDSNYCLLAFCDLLEEWKDSSHGLGDARLPRPEAVRTFEFSVTTHYSTQDHRDSEEIGMHMWTLDILWSALDFAPDEDGRIKTILDAFPIVAEVLRSMTSLERLLRRADLPMIYDIDDAIVNLPQCEHRHEPHGAGFDTDATRTTQCEIFM